MTVAQLYAVAADRGIEIDDFPLRELQAISFPEGWIAIDRRKFSNEAEFKCALAHEIGHCATGSFYKIDSPARDKAMSERFANRFAAELLVPLAELKKLMHRGILFNRILIQIFDVTLAFIDMVLDLFEQELFAAARIRVSPYQITAAVISNLMPFVSPTFVNGP